MKRILVVLPNWFGDTLFATPVLRALRRERPNAFIATLGWPNCREMLQHNPCVDMMLDYDEKGRDRSLGAKWALVRMLRSHHFDAALLLRKSFSRALLLACARIPVRVGFDHSKANWLLTHHAPMPVGPVHKAASYRPLLAAIGLTSALESYEYFVSEEERCQAQALLRTPSGVDGARLVVLHPGANWFHKRWAPERFAALGDRLMEQAAARIVITGAPDDRTVVESIAARMHHPVTVLAGETTLRQLGACLQQAQLVVSNDTGISHMAAALGRPLVALYGPTSPLLTGPLGDPQRTIVVHHVDCCPEIPCYHPTDPPHPGMNAITVDEAYSAAVQLLRRHDG